MYIRSLLVQNSHCNVLQVCCIFDFIMIVFICCIIAAFLLWTVIIRVVWYIGISNYQGIELETALV